jgi:peptidoglycan/LPS O-acetylase OafA/YrhL
MPYPIAAAAVGILVAVFARVLVFAGEQACDAVRGTTSCGSAGGFMLLAIGALVVFLGTRMLRVLRVPDPGISSLLGASLLGIVILGVLIDDIFSPWMWVVLPVVSAVIYAFAAWAATALSEAGKG